MRWQRHRANSALDAGRVYGTRRDVYRTGPLGVELIDGELAIVRRAGPLPEPGPAPFLVVDAGAAGRIVDWVALAWGREPTSPTR